MSDKLYNTLLAICAFTLAGLSYWASNTSDLTPAWIAAIVTVVMVGVVIVNRVIFMANKRDRTED